MEDNMSTAEQKPKEKTQAEKFAALTRDIDWQRASFLNYCLRITESPLTNQSPEEIVVKKILGGYLTLAMLYFNQFREDLKKQYINPSLIIHEMDVKLKMQEAMDKLLEEWHRVYAIIVAIRAREVNKESKRLVDQMSPFVDAAMRDVGLSREKFPVILQFGQSYSLRFSRYSDGFAALGIPLWVLASPWEWTILWHELAGEKVRQLKLQAPNFFTSQFDGIVESLQHNEKSQILEAGWSVNWLEELFEDSFSVLHFPIHFLFVFKNLLERYPDSGQGQRHPPRAIRLATAMCLHLRLKEFKELPKDMKDWNPILWKKWVELKDEKEPKRFSEFDPNTQLSNEINIKVVWLVAKKIIKWHRSNKIDKDQDNNYQKIIRTAIIDYSRGADRIKTIDLAIGGITRLNNSLKTKDLVANRQGIIDDTFSAICDLVANGNLSKLSKTDRYKMHVAHPQVPKMLGRLGYQELLDLSFSDVDYHNVNDIHFRQNEINYWVDPTTWNNRVSGKFTSYDGNSKNLKLGNIEIQEIGVDNNIEFIKQRWQAALVDWNRIQKSTS